MSHDNEDLSLSDADRAHSPQERLAAYDRLVRYGGPSWERQFARTKRVMSESLPGALTGTLRDLATFILAANSNEIAQYSLLKMKKLTYEMHPSTPRDGERAQICAGTFAGTEALIRSAKQ